MSSNICDQLRERGEHVGAEFIERLGVQLAEADRVNLVLERAYSQQQKVWSATIARVDRYEEALRKIACKPDQGEPCTCADQNECSYGIAYLALKEAK